MKGAKVTLESPEGFTAMRKLVDEIEGRAKSGDIEGLESAVDELRASLGELQEFIDYAKDNT